MLSIEKCPVPPATLLAAYALNGAYADCYSTEIAGQVSFSTYVFSFYTTPLFKLERLILKGLVSKPSSDHDAMRLLDGHMQRFAAWYVEGRNENELLMCDFRERTRSWFLVSPVNATRNPRTRLYFGSAVVPVRNSKTGKTSLGFGYKALLGFHQIYSVLLLLSARSRIKSRLSSIAP
jgi:hypothetical protein